MDENQREQRRLQMFGDFRQALEAWPDTGKEPPQGNQDIRYYLDLQEQRLKKHGIRLQLQLKPLDEAAHFNALFINKLDQTLYAQHVVRTASYYRGEKRLLRRQNCLAMYQTILDPQETDLGDSTYVCPNCGSVSTLSALQEEGCPYCGTRYLMKDLYPKVVNYYYFEEGLKSEEQYKDDHRLVWIWSLIVSKFLATTIAWIANKHFDPAVIGLVGLWLIPVLMVPVYMILFWLSLVLDVFRTSGLAGRYIVLIKDTYGQKEKITEKLRKKDPAFSFEYFESRALCLARILMLSGEPETCTQYAGEGIRDRFEDVIDIQYRGGMALKTFREVGDHLETELTLFLTNTLDDGKKLRLKDEKVHITMYHNKNFPVETEFSILKVQCRGCGGSFDARKRKNCPYCGETYDAGLDDWVVTDIRR